MTEQGHHDSYPNSSRSKHTVERVLAVSDNQELCQCLRAEISRNLFEHPLHIDYCYTSLNQNPQQMIEIGATQIDVQDDVTVDRLIASYDLVFSLHCKQIFPKRLVENVRCINIHPGFNPHNRGWFPQAFSIVNGLPVGATIHLMDADVDHGPIIAQEAVEIEPSDTSLEVYRKIIEIEKQLIHKHIYNIIEGTYDTFLPPCEGNYNSIKDYRELCQLQLDSTDTLRNHINLLRGTTHGSLECVLHQRGWQEVFRSILLSQPEPTPSSPASILGETRGRKHNDSPPIWVRRRELLTHRVWKSIVPVYSYDVRRREELRVQPPCADPLMAIIITAPGPDELKFFDAHGRSEAGAN